MDFTDFLSSWMFMLSDFKDKFSCAQNILSPDVVSSYRISYRLIQLLFLIRLVSQLSALSGPNSHSWKNSKVLKIIFTIGKPFKNAKVQTSTTFNSRKVESEFKTQNSVSLNKH